MSQPLVALSIADSVKRERSRLRHEARERPELLEDLLTSPPASVATMPVVDLLRLVSGYRATRALTVIGRRAANDGVNLMLATGLPASKAARDWCLRNVEWKRSPSGARLAVRRTA